MKPLDIGYINKNNQKNLGCRGKSDTHYNQRFFEMECLNCGHKYMANGCDVWLRKCPVCQNDSPKATITAEIIAALEGTPIGTEFERSEIISMVRKKFRRPEGSVIPSDYCYNRVNNGIRYEKQIHLFEYTEEKKYKYLGIDYPYTGSVFHKPKGESEVCVGKVENGSFSWSIPIATPQDPPAAPSASPIARTTKRDPSLSLRFRVLKRDHFTCCCCGASPAKDPSVELHIDHIIPWAKGGETTLDNLQTLCSHCNLGKGDTP